MSRNISERAIISNSSVIAEYVVIEDCVIIHDRVSIGAGSTIKAGTEIFEDCILGEKCSLGENIIIKNRSILADNIVLEDNIYVDYNVIIRNSVTIGEKSFIGAGCILGEYLVDFLVKRDAREHPLSIGKEALIRSETIIYGECRIGHHFETGHRVSIRERSVCGDFVRIGTHSDLQGDCEIQDYVNLHSNVHVGKKSVIKRFAWIFPYVILTNDPNPPSEVVQGVVVEEFAVVSTGTVVLPGVRIGKEALVGAGAVVTKDVEDSRVVLGNPARNICATERILNKNTGEKVYPWKYTFERRMPWEGVGFAEWERTQYSEHNINPENKF